MADVLFQRLNKCFKISTTILWLACVLLFHFLFNTVTLNPRRFRSFTAEGCVSITTAGQDTNWIYRAYLHDEIQQRAFDGTVVFWCVVCIYAFLFLFFYIYFVLQMNSRRSTQGCPRTTSWMCRPSSTCGRWTLRSSGATSSWRPVCAFCPGALRESSSSCSASAKDATGSHKSTCRENGQHKTAFRHLYSCVLACVYVCVWADCLYKQRTGVKLS